MPQELLKNEDTKVFSFNLEVHRELQSRKIKHEIADNLLNQEARFQLFDKGLKFLSWSSRIPSSDLEFEGINLLKIFDSHEFHSYLMPNLVNFIIIKRVIEKEQPTKIICSSLLSKIVKSLTKGTDVQTQFFQNNLKKNLLWDRIPVKYNFGKISISFNLSKNNYLKIKKSAESLVGFFSDFWLDCKNSQKSIVLLEFNTELFSNLLFDLKNYDGNIILVNQRRSAIWSKKAIDVVKKSNCKILNFDKVLTDDEKLEIPKLVEEYSKKLEKFWKNSEFFEKLFQIENSNFWEVIKDVIISSYYEKLPYYIFLAQSIKTLFTKMDIRCIVSLNEIGETEKAFLEFNKRRVSSILLEHGFVERVDETKRFDKLLYVNFRDKIATWGNVKKDYLINEYGIAPERIFVTGSPRHDVFFNSRIKKKSSDEITILLAPNPITEISGLANTNLELKFEQTINQIFSILKQFRNVNPIVKLHKSQLPHNMKIRSLIKKIDSTIPVYQSTPIIETINKADIVIVVSPESFGTSTMLLESMILGKPTMNIILDDEIPQFNHVKEKAILTLSDNQDLEDNMKKILFDEQFQKKIIQNADSFVAKFLDFRGNSSEEFANILKSF